MRTNIRIDWCLGFMKKSNYHEVNVIGWNSIIYIYIYIIILDLRLIEFYKGVEKSSWVLIEEYTKLPI